MLIEPVITEDRARLLNIAISTGLFTDGEAEALLGGVLSAFTSGTLPSGHQAVSIRNRAGEPALGWSYFAPDQYAEDVWNVWWIGIDPQKHGTGAAQTLLRYIEDKVALVDGRVLVIETSSGDALARARRFYLAQGYAECGRIPDFYAPGESKVIFARHPRSA